MPKRCDPTSLTSVVRVDYGVCRGNSYYGRKSFIRDTHGEPTLREEIAEGPARRDGRRAPAQARAGAGDADGLGIGAVIGAGIFVATGAAAKDVAGPGPDGLLRRRRHHLHLRRPVLRRVRLDGARRRQRLHLRLHHDGRAVRLDHRLGPGAGIRRRRRHGRQRLVGLLSECAAQIRHRRAGRPCPGRRTSTTRATSCRTSSRSIASRSSQKSMDLEARRLGPTAACKMPKGNFWVLRRQGQKAETAQNRRWTRTVVLGKVGDEAVEAKIKQTRSMPIGGRRRKCWRPRYQ